MLNASVTSASMILPNIQVGKNLENVANISLNGAAPASGLVITVSSNDPSRLLLSNTPNGAGSSSIFVQVQGNRSTSLDFYVQGLAASGNVFYTAAAAVSAATRGQSV